MKRKAILIMFLSLFLSGCGQKVVTVADIQTEEGQESGYIEMQEFELKKTAGQEAPGREEADYCAVLIPAGYQESEEIPGMYIHERSPLDSSNIYYTVSEGSGAGWVSEGLTEEIFKETLEDAYQKAGRELDLTVRSFEKIDMDGIPGYKIRSTYGMGDEAVEQLAYLILADETYTITYSQMADDELMADFEISDGQIRLVREDEVSLAQSGQEDKGT